MMGDASEINNEVSKYQAITTQYICDSSAKVFNKTNCSTIFYLAEK
jgi:hypothetical protein